MFDTMTITKAAGAIFAALLVFLLGGLAADGLYNIDNDEEERVSGYRPEVEEVAVVEAEPEPEVDFAEVYAAADAAAGENLWRQCAACHALDDGQNQVGPYLFGVVGRAVGSASGFGYSDTMAGFGGEWTPENLSGFLENPRGYMAGTAMSYRGMDDIEDRANLIAYLATIQ